jgi:hypothetical protein
MIRNNRIGFDLPVDNLKTGKVRRLSKYIKADRFPLMLITANKERKQI